MNVKTLPKSDRNVFYFIAVFMALLLAETVHSVYTVIKEIDLLTFSDFLELSIKRILAEGPPSFKLLPVIRIFLVMALSFCIVYWIASFKKLPQQKKSGVIDHEIIALSSSNVLGNFTIITVHIIFFIIFVTNPFFYNVLGSEDNVVENGSAYLYFISSLVFLVLFIKIRTVDKHIHTQKIICGLLVFVFFFLGMEEVSWMQRVLEIKTTGVFEQNKQKELNFHNFMTDPIENIYYFGAFIFLVFLPFLFTFFSFPKKFEYLQEFVPGKFILLVSCIIFAYNYDMWNIIFMQIAFFLSLFILCYYAIVDRQKNQSVRLLLLLTIFLMIIFQGIFILRGHHQIRNYDVTEYKEFFIPLSFFLYSIGVFFNLNKKLIA